MTKGSLRIGCDNEKAGWISNDTSTRVKSSVKHLDLVHSIRRLKATLRTSVTFYHIFGHQDKHMSYDCLSRDAQVNVLVDHQAQSHFDTSFESDTFHSNPSFLSEGWSVVLGGVKLVDSHRTHIRHWIAKHRLRQYLYDTDRISWTTFPLIDFEPLQHYLSYQSQTFQLWFTKHWTDFCGIGSKMKIMKLWTTDLCPCCQQVPETSTTHLYICPHPSLRDLRNTLFRDILDWLLEVHTCPHLYHIIESLWKGRSPSLDRDTPFAYRRVLGTLQEIGVASMWRGFLPAGMVDLQSQHYQSWNHHRSGAKWGNNL